MSTLSTKYVEMIDKENTKIGVVLTKKDKAADECLPRKTVLGDANQQIRVVEEPSSP